MCKINCYLNYGNEFDTKIYINFNSKRKPQVGTKTKHVLLCVRLHLFLLFSHFSARS